MGLAADARVMTEPPSRFENSGKAIVEVQEAFNDWSNILRKHSTEAMYAVIAANWATYGSAKAILATDLAKLSMAAAISFLGLQIIGSWFMVRLHHTRLHFAEANHSLWEEEFHKTKDTNDPWPYTFRIEHLGVAMRWTRLILPITAASLFVLSLFV